MTDLRRVLIAGPDGAMAQAIAARLLAEGCVVTAEPAGINEAGPWGIVVIAEKSSYGPIDSLDLTDFLDRFDTAMNEAASVVRDVLDAGTLRRIVLVGSLGARGQASASVPAAIGGGLIALARSWALEFVAEGITANAVLVSDVEGDPSVTEGVAEAAAFLLSPRTAAISGQVLRISNDTDAGILPL
jgi:NAD(P)-dependent dehydrogenase (short-subunit alcohol dehydrogenase family)